MPAFLAGLGYARALSAVLQVPLYRLSHQENHLLAVLRSLGKVEQEPFYGIHLSGGTTELVRAVPDDKGLDITRIGGTSDISAGQFIDRMGVAMNLPFPAGVHVDKLSQEFSGTLKGAHVFFKDGEVSFSGPESQGQRLLRDGEADIPRICRWTLATVWRGLSRLLDYAVADGMTHLVAPAASCLIHICAKNLAHTANRSTSDSTLQRMASVPTMLREPLFGRPYRKGRHDEIRIGYGRRPPHQRGYT